MSEIVVVGAGLVGAAIARRLAERGASVHVVEAERPAGGASLATFAWVNAVGKEPRGYFDLNAAGVAEHRRLVEEIGDGSWYHPSGNLEWSPDGDRLGAKVEAHRARGYNAVSIDLAEARRLEPDVSIADGSGVAFYPDDAWVDPALLVRRLLDLPRIVLSPATEVARVDAVGGRTGGVVLADGHRLAADAVVIATGPAASELTRTAGFDLPMRHAPGLLALTAPASIRVGRILHAPGIAARPDGAGRLLLAADDLDKQIEPAGGATTIPEATDDLLRRAANILPRLAGVPIEVARVGRRALTTDAMPAIGPVPGCAGVYLAVMHSGVTLAPLIGRLVAEEIINAAEDERLTDYRPARFAGVDPGT